MVAGSKEAKGSMAPVLVALWDWVQRTPWAKKFFPFLPMLVVAVTLLWRYGRAPTPWYKKHRTAAKKKAVAALSKTEVAAAAKQNADKAEVLLTAFGAGRLKPIAFQNAGRDFLDAAVSQGTYSPAHAGLLPLKAEVFLFELPVFLAEFFAHENEFLELDQKGEAEEKMVIYSCAFNVRRRCPGLHTQTFTTTGANQVPMKTAIQAAILDFTKQCVLMAKDLSLDLPVEARHTLEAMLEPGCQVGAAEKLLAAYALSTSLDQHFRGTDQRRQEKDRLYRLIAALAPAAQADATAVVAPFVKAVTLEVEKALNPIPPIPEGDEEEEEEEEGEAKGSKKDN